MRLRIRLTLALALVATATASAAGAQLPERLSVLRIWPAATGVHPLESLVITFDHPVAPKLGETIDPARVVRLTPSAPARMFWQDPSTIVVEFDRPWTFGRPYDVEIDPGLRSATGLKLASGQTRRMWVRPARLIAMRASERFGQSSTEQQPLAVYESAMSLGKLTGRAWIVPSGPCPIRDSIPLVADSIRPVAANDPSWILNARGDKRDTRLDTLRRVVRFTAVKAMPRGCEAILRLPLGEEQGNGTSQLALRTPVPFRVDSVGFSARAPATAHVVIRFSVPVTEQQIRAGVTINGKRAVGIRPYGDRTDPRLEWVFSDSVRAGGEVEVEVSGDLLSANDERLGASMVRRIVAPHRRPDAQFAIGRVIVPKDARTLLIARHVNTDSVTVVIARVVASARARALDTRYLWYPINQWKELRGDTVARTIASPAPIDSMMTLAIPASLIPTEWREDPLLLVRVAVAASPPPKGAPRSIRVVATPVDRSYTQFAIVQRTNLAAHAVAFAGKTEVWVTSLRTAAPVAGAVVRVLGTSDTVLASGRTDARGRVRVDYSEAWRRADSALVLEVARDADRLLLALPDERYARDPADDDDDIHTYGMGPNLSGNGVVLHGVAFSERGIYRPGDRVHLKGLARTIAPYGDIATPAGDSARWSIFRLGDRGDNDLLARHATTLTSFGTAVDSFDVPRTASLGRYQAILALRDSRGWRKAAHAEFDVAEYRPTEFNLALHADTSIARFAGDTVRARARADYLFGMPMAGAAVGWSAALYEFEPWQVRVPGLDGYTTGRSWWRLPDGERPTTVFSRPDSAVLDAHGEAAITLPIGRTTIGGRMVISAMAMDANRRIVTTERTVLVHAADAYVGVRPASNAWYHDVRDSIALQMLVVHADGRRRSGTPIRIVAQRYGWSADRWKADTVWRAEQRSESEPVRVVFRAPTPGWYELLATVEDEAGRKSTTGYDLWVTGHIPGMPSPTAGRLEIRPDRQRYAPGDVATVVITSPVEQHAWIMLSQSVPLGEQLVPLHVGPNVVRVPIPMAAMPKADLRVIGVAPLGAGFGDRSSYLSVESRSLDVSAAPRQLDVRVSTDRDSYSPGDDVRVRVKVTDAAHRGRRAEATIWAVDEGVSLLTAYARPDVLDLLLGNGFVAPWYGSSLQATVLALSPNLLRLSDQVQVRIRGMSSITGATASLESVVVVGYGAQTLASAPLRQRFVTTPFFAGAIVTDSLGAAEVRFKLPDNVTTYRVFATAVTEGTEAGSGDTTLVSTRPLIVRPALPRIVRLGDTLLAGGVVTQNSSAQTPISLQVESSGIALSGATTKRGTLDGRKATELRFPMRVVSGDSVSVTLRGGSAEHGDAVKLTLPVSPAGHARAHVVTGMLEGHTTLGLPILDGIDADRSGVAIQLGTSLLPIVRQTSEALRIYPYYCTEQLSSAGRALLARFEMERALDSAAALTPRDRTQLEMAVSLVVARQTEEGGFGYWSRDNWTSPYLTAYALDMLVSARAAGIDVPASATRRAAAYLKAAVANRLLLDPWRLPDSTAFGHDALAVARTLRRLGEPDAALERQVSGFRSAMPFVDRLDLAMLRAAVGDTADARALVDGAWRATHLSGRKVILDDSTAGNGWLFPSRLRPTARLISTTAMLEPRHPLLGALVESLVQGTHADRDWAWNTHDQSATAEAIAAVRSVLLRGGTRSVAVSGPGGTLARSRFEPGHTDSVAVRYSAVLPGGRDVTSPQLTLDADTKTPIYYAATVLEVPRARPVRADDEGISVERWYESYEEGKPIISVREGQLVRVRLRITVPSTRDFVAVDDPLPAGLEAVDLSLRTSSTLAPFAGAPKQSHDSGAMPGGRWRYGRWDGGWWSPWEHREIRDDRVLYFARQLWKGTFEASYVARATTVGTFVRPPAHAEEMYNPAVHGRSDGGVFTVTERE